SVATRVLIPWTAVTLFPVLILAVLVYQQAYGWGEAVAASNISASKLPEKISDLLERLSWLGAGVAVGGVLLGLAAAVLVSGQLTRRINLLRETVLRVLTGEPGARVPELGHDEIARLGEELNRLLEQATLAAWSSQETDAMQHSITKLLDEISGV